jgi:uncharacterized membrane protein
MALELTSALLVTGLVLVAAGVPLMHRRVPPNRWYGIRFPSTLADERTWYAVNARSGRDLLILGVAITLLSLGAPLVLPRWQPELRALPVAFALIIGLAVITVRAVRHARQMGRG